MFKFFNLHLAIYLHAKTKTGQQPFNHSIILFHNLLRILSNLGVYRSHNNLIFLLFFIHNKYHYTEFLKKRNIDCTCYKMKFHLNKKEQTPRTENHIHSTTGKVTAKKNKKKNIFLESLAWLGDEQKQTHDQLALEMIILTTFSLTTCLLNYLGKPISTCPPYQLDYISS